MKVTFESGGGGAALKLTVEHYQLMSILIVEGTLVGNTEDEAVLEAAFRHIDHTLDSLRIDPRACRIGPGAEVLWAQLVTQKLAWVSLSYMAGDLSLLTQKCPEYRHERSRFEDPA
jgi:hypothetical protein